MTKKNKFFGRTFNGKTQCLENIIFVSNIFIAKQFSGSTSNCHPQHQPTNSYRNLYDQWELSVISKLSMYHFCQHPPHRRLNALNAVGQHILPKSRMGTAWTYAHQNV